MGNVIRLLIIQTRKYTVHTSLSLFRPINRYLKLT